jgi:mono/diheme cytochrome c family protein
MLESRRLRQMQLTPVLDCFADRLAKHAPRMRAVLIVLFLMLVAGFQSCSGRPPTGNSSATTTKHGTRPLTNRRFEVTPERLARGRYLAEGVGYCIGCHSPVDTHRAGWPPVLNKIGAGFDYASWGYPGQVTPNITPDLDTGIGNWTDDMLARAIREGVGHDGHLLDPATMPYEFQRFMSDEDLASIIVYLRSIPPIRNSLPAFRATREVVSPFAIPIWKPIPQPDKSTNVKRGAYLVQLGACQWCHTLRDANRQSLPGLAFGGGDLIVNAYESASSANISPDPSGISYYDEAQFLRTMRTGHVGARKISSNMPWWYFGHMTDDDLRAIFAYLRTVPPVKHRVDNGEPVSYCKVCGRKHGGGSLN